MKTIPRLFAHTLERENQPKYKTGKLATGDYSIHAGEQRQAPTWAWVGLMTLGLVMLILIIA